MIGKKFGYPQEKLQAQRKRWIGSNQLEKSKQCPTSEASGQILQQKGYLLG
jgi:hypothetical protein